MKDRNQIMNDYFDNVTRDQLLHDIKETGMLDKRPSVESKHASTMVSKNTGATVVKPSTNRVKYGHDPFVATGINNRKRKKRPSPFQGRRSSNH
ncbi:hypothetical protein [Priestia sp. JNUCC 25]